MRFLDEILVLMNSYPKKSCKDTENAHLLGVFKSKPPIAEHVVYFPLSNELRIQLLGKYKQPFPCQLQQLYSFMNGADLFWTKRKNEQLGFELPVCCFSLYGYSDGVNRSRMESYNISIEDLSRPEGTPKHWLKFGNYRLPSDLNTEMFLFVDTQTQKTYSLLQQSKMAIANTWDSIDDCLCDILARMGKAKIN